MPLRIVDEIKETASSSLQQASLISAAAFALLIAAGFLCAAAFVFVLEKYGPVAACLACTGIFLILAGIAAAIYAIRKRQIEARARQRARTTAHLLADPAVVATGMQIVRAIGLKRLIPLIAVGGAALGFLATRAAAARDEAPAE